jgi:predicted nuclease with TOPRIM domain
MEVCEGSRPDGHEEVCFSCRLCPACEAQEALRDVGAERDGLVVKIDGLESDLSAAQQEQSAKKERDEYEAECTELRSRVETLEADNSLLQDEVGKLRADSHG